MLTIVLLFIISVSHRKQKIGIKHVK